MAKRLFAKDRKIKKGGQGMTERLKKINVKDIDFLQGADNVYRTDKFIIRQKISVTTDENLMGMTLSKDTYFLRTEERDAIYNAFFKFREEKINGKRINAQVSIKKYVDGIY